MVGEEVSEPVKGVQRQGDLVWPVQLMSLKMKTTKIGDVLLFTTALRNMDICEADCDIYNVCLNLFHEKGILSEINFSKGTLAL